MKRLLGRTSFALLSAAVALGPVPSIAAGNYPNPNFSQVHAGELVGGTGIAPIKCNLDADSTTCHIVVDAGTGFGTTALDGTGSLSSLNATDNIALSGSAGITFTVSGTWTGTLNFNASANNGVTFPAPVYCGSLAHGAGTSFSANDTYYCSPVGYGIFQITMSAYTSGTANIAYHVSPNPVGQQIVSQSGQVAAVNYPADSQTYLGIATIAQMMAYNSNINNNERTRTSSSNTDGFTHTAGITATTQNSTGPEAPISADNSFTTGLSPISTATTTQLIALAAGKNIYITGFDLSVGTGSTVYLEYGSGTNCATGTGVLTTAFPAGTITKGGAIGTVLKPIPAGNAVCAVTTGTGGVGIDLTFGQF